MNRTSLQRRSALGAPPGRFVSPGQKRRILERDGWACGYCHCTLGLAEAVIDHCVPYNAGGPTTDDNLLACCRPCNRAKRNRPEVEYRACLEGI